MLDSLRSYWRGPVSTGDKALNTFFSYGSTPSSTGIVVNEDNALSYSAVWAAESLISSGVANLPLVLYLKDGKGGKERYEKHNLYRLLHDRPNPEMSSFSFREALTGHALSYGNGYAEIERDGANRPVALWPISPDRIKPFRHQGELYYEVYNGSGNNPTILHSMNVIHIHGFSFDGITGYGVIQKMRESIGLGLAAETFGGTFFGNGTQFGGIFKHPTRLTEGARKNFIESMNARHQGPQNAHKFMVVEEGMEFSKLGVDPDHAQFLETRIFQLDEVARWFNVPPHKLKNLLRSTNNNIEHQNLEYYIDCLSPWTNKWDQELEYKLIAPSERNLQEIEHVTEGLLRADMAGRGTFFQARFNTASMTPNEIRKIENQNPIPGGDTPFVQLGFVPLSMVEAYYEAEIDGKKAEAEAKRRPPPTPVAPDPATEQKMRALEDERDLARKVAQEAEDARDLALNMAKVAVEAKDLANARLAEAVIEHRDVVEAVRAEKDTELSEERSKREAVEASRLKTVDTCDLIDGWRIKAVEEAAARTRERDAALATVEKLTNQTQGLSLDVTVAQRDIVAAEKREEAALQSAARAQQRIVDVTVATRAAVIDRLSYMVEHESDRARAKQQSPDKLLKWAGEFYSGDYPDKLRAILRPSVKAWAVCVNHPEPVEHVLDLLVGQHVEQSVRQLRTVAEENDQETLAPALEKVLRRWEATRAETLADRVLKEAA